MRVRAWPAEVVFDSVVFLAGVGVGLSSVLLWLVHGHDSSLPALVAIPVIAGLSRYPLVLRHQVGDIVIGFEASALVYLLLTVPVMQALAFWSVGSVVAQVLATTGHRAKAFNIGVTLLGGGAVAWVGTRLARFTVLSPGRLGLIMAGCAVYFLFDLMATSVSLAIESRAPLHNAVRWHSVWLGLCCFVGVDTLGYLAAVLQHREPGWTLALLLVPIGTILVAVRSVGGSRLAQQRLGTLFEAATEAPDWPDDPQVERALVAKAEQVLRRSTAQLRLQPPDSDEIGAVLRVPGVVDRFLVARRTPGTTTPFDVEDERALSALTAIGQAALNRQRMAGEMSYLARHDVLTGLSNRVVLADRLEHALARRGGQTAVLYCDLDGFKAVNDRYGHAAGDLLLVAVARRLTELVRPEDTVARIGGDEFAVLLDDAGHAAHAQRLAERVSAALHRPFEVQGHEVRVGVSIGVALAAGGDSGESGEELLRDADIAMYHVKSHGRGGLHLFHPSLRTESLRQLELREELRRAVDDGSIALHFQPMVDLATGVIDGFEALARWSHPTLGEIAPDVFIPLAEQLGLIPRLGEFVLAHAHQVARELAARAGRPLTIGVNVSPLQLQDPRLVTVVQNLVRSDPAVVVALELTEGTILGDDEDTLQVLLALRAAGAVLVVDDFGVGYSSVSYLHRLPVEVVKVDRSFVRGMDDARTVALVEGIIAMAAAMNLRVVAEGIEDWRTAGQLAALGCQLGQGFLFARPLPREQALELAAVGRVERGQPALVGSETGAGARA